MLVGIGVEVTFEVVAAAAMLRRRLPAMRVRVVNVTDLMILEPYGAHPHALSQANFVGLFTNDRPIHFNYHGYPGELKVRPVAACMSHSALMELAAVTVVWSA